MGKRYRRLRGDTAYYPFAARTHLRARQRRHAKAADPGDDRPGQQNPQRPLAQPPQPPQIGPVEPAQVIRNVRRVPHLLRGPHLRVVGGEALGLVLFLEILDVPHQLPAHRRPVRAEGDLPGGLLHPNMGEHPYVPASTAVTAPA